MADNTRLAFPPFGKSRLYQDFANPKRYLPIAGKELFSVPFGDGGNPSP